LKKENRILVAQITLVVAVSIILWGPKLVDWGLQAADNTARTKQAAGEGVWVRPTPTMAPGQGLLTVGVYLDGNINPQAASVLLEGKDVPAQSFSLQRDPETFLMTGAAFMSPGEYAFNVSIMPSDRVEVLENYCLGRVRIVSGQEAVCFVIMRIW
jgi:hypothetical protein